MRHWDLHQTILAASAGSTLAAVWDFAASAGPTVLSAVPVLLSCALTVWQFLLVRKRELAKERLDETDKAHAAELKRERKRREQAREQDRLDAEQRIELARLEREAGAPAKEATT